MKAKRDGDIPTKRCDRCGGATFPNIDGDLDCLVCGAVLYARLGYERPGAARWEGKRHGRAKD